MRMWDWASYFAGLATGAVIEVAIGALITAPLAVWWLKRNMASVMESFAGEMDDPGTVARIKAVIDKFIPPSVRGLLSDKPPTPKQALGMGISLLMRYGAAWLASKMPPGTQPQLPGPPQP